MNLPAIKSVSLRWGFNVKKTHHVIRLYASYLPQDRVCFETAPIDINFHNGKNRILRGHRIYGQEYAPVIAGCDFEPCPAAKT